MNIICMYHANCMDGFTAAWIVQKAFEHDNVVFVPANYNDNLLSMSFDAREKMCDLLDVDNLSEIPVHLFMVDFSAPKETLLELNKFFKSVLVLDHHKTAEESLVGIELNHLRKDVRYSNTSISTQKPNVLFDMERAGAQIARDFFYNELFAAGVEDPSELSIVEYVSDRDLWKFEIPYSKEINAFLATLPMTFDEWESAETYLNDKSELVITTGAFLLKQQQNYIDKHLKLSSLRWIDFEGHYIPTCNAPYYLASEIGNQLCEKYDAPFAMIYSIGEKGVYHSLRAKNKVDVSAIAQKHGGGGHKNAAGFFTTKLLPIIEVSDG